MKQKLVILNEDKTVSQVKLKNLSKSINPKKVAGVIVPLPMCSDIQECMILRPDRMIMKFSRAEIKIRFTFYNTYGISFGDPDAMKWSKENLFASMPESVFHPKDIMEFYSVLHNIDRVQYINCCTDTCASELDYEDITIMDIDYLEINAYNTNLGDINLKFSIKSFYPSEGAATFCDIISEKLRPIFDPITRQFRSNERVRIYDNKWTLTRKINDDGLYGAKMYPSTVVFIDECRYKQYKTIFANHHDLWIDYIAINSNDYNTENIPIDMLLSDFCGGLKYAVTYRMFSPEDLFEVVTSFEAFRISLRMLAVFIGIASDVSDISVTAVIARANSDWSIRCLYDETWDHCGDFIIRDKDTPIGLSQRIFDNFRYDTSVRFIYSRGDNYEAY